MEAALTCSSQVLSQTSRLPCLWKEVRRTLHWIPSYCFIMSWESDSMRTTYQGPILFQKSNQKTNKCLHHRRSFVEETCTSSCSLSDLADMSLCYMLNGAQLQPLARKVGYHPPDGIWVWISQIPGQHISTAWVFFWAMIPQLQRWPIWSPENFADARAHSYHWIRIKSQTISKALLMLTEMRYNKGIKHGPHMLTAEYGGELTKGKLWQKERERK